MPFPPTTRSGLPRTLVYAECAWRLLALGDLEALAGVVEPPDVRPWFLLAAPPGQTPGERLRELVAQGDAGAAVTLRIDDAAGPVGICGVTLRDGGLAVRTYLQPRVHGGPVNAAAKLVLWQVSALLGLPLRARIDASNLRSRSALERLWPACAGEPCPSVGRPGISYCYELVGPPRDGLPLALREIIALDAMLAQAPIIRRVAIAGVA